MRHLAPLSFLCACLSACEPLPGDVDLGESGTSAEAIINGESCGPDRLETAVAILVDAEVDFGFAGTQKITTIICTGTLIAPDVVLTAAHCLDATALTLGFGEVKSEEYYVSFESDLSALADGQGMAEIPEGSIHAIGKAVHPDFDLNSLTAENVNGPGNFYDVAVLFLERTVDHLLPEVVVTAAEASQIVEGATVEIAGWGQQTVTSGPFDPPPEGTYAKKMCATSFIGELGTHEMQIGGDSTTSRKCHGDSGGPTYLEVETSHARTRRVIGITSHAYDESDCQKGGVDTRVDAWLEWIDGEMKKGCDDGTRVWCQVEGIIPPSYYDPQPDPDNPADPDGDGKVDRQNDDDQDDEGCGCRATRAGGEPLLGLLALASCALLRRRRT